MTRILANTHALASQILYAARMAVTDSRQYEEEVDRRLRQLEGLNEWELAWVRNEVAFRMASGRSRS